MLSAGPQFGGLASLNERRMIVMNGFPMHDAFDSYCGCKACFDAETFALAEAAEDAREIVEEVQAEGVLSGAELVMVAAAAERGGHDPVFVGNVSNAVESNVRAGRSNAAAARHFFDWSADVVAEDSTDTMFAAELHQAGVVFERRAAAEGVDDFSEDVHSFGWYFEPQHFDDMADDMAMYTADRDGILYGAVCG